MIKSDSKIIYVTKFRFEMSDVFLLEINVLFIKESWKKCIMVFHKNIMQQNCFPFLFVAY